MIAALLASCAPPEAALKTGTNSSDSENGSTHDPGVTPVTPGPEVIPPPQSPVLEYNVEVPPLWEKARPSDGRSWTLHSFKIIDTYGDALINGSSDIKQFCPSYSALTRNLKLNFWTYLVSAVAQYESAFDPTNRYQETTLGTDAITKQPVWSEGLLQLSYQDVTAYSFCHEFDWAHDKLLSAKDPKKTILDPFKNLSCGIRILNSQVRKKDLIAVSGYWSTLSPTNKYTKISAIKAVVNTIAFCH